MFREYLVILYHKRRGENSLCVDRDASAKARIYILSAHLNRKCGRAEKKGGDGVTKNTLMHTNAKKNLRGRKKGGGSIK